VWPQDGKLVVGGLKTEVKGVWLLADKASKTGQKLKVVRLNRLDVSIEGLPLVASDENDSVIVLDCAGESQADPARLLSPAVGTDTLRSFDAKLEGKLQFGAGKTGAARVSNWKQTNDAVVWLVRLNEVATFEATLVYDALTYLKRHRVFEGAAGKELQRGSSEAAGIYTVTAGRQTFARSVKAGIQVRETLGRVKLPPGRYEFRVAAKAIAGEELFRLR
jgi:hypothetical protein